MSDVTYDLVVIGAGPGGYVAASDWRRDGHRVIIKKNCKERKMK